MTRALADLAPLTTTRLLLARLTVADVPAVQALTDDPEVVRRIDFLTSPFTLADAAALVARNSDPDECFFGVWESSRRRLIGVIGAHLRGAEEVEIGYWLGRGHQGRGYATEAVTALIAGLRRAYPERQIVAECDPQNIGSWRVLEKAGFRPAGQAGHRPGRQLLHLAR